MENYFEDIKKELNISKQRRDGLQVQMQQPLPAKAVLKKGNSVRTRRNRNQGCEKKV